MLSHPVARTNGVNPLIEKSVTQRVQRGRAIVGQVQRHGDLFTVEGKGGTYTVSLDNVNGEVCECKDWQRHYDRNGFGHICKHIFAVTIANAKG